jgi:hypothetical protein
LPTTEPGLRPTLFYALARNSNAVEATAALSALSKKKKRKEKNVALATCGLGKPYKGLIPNGLTVRGRLRIPECDLSHCCPEFFLT